MNEHPDFLLIERYTAGDPQIDEVSLWSLEAHLETCADCRAQQAELFNHDRADQALVSGRDLLERVTLVLDERIAAGLAPTPIVARWTARRRWAVWSLLPWVAMTVGVLLAAMGLNYASPEGPSLVLLVAPVLPLLGVAGTWSRRTDPAWELLAGSPRMGLWLLLRRTAMVLLVVIPLLLAAGWVGGLAPALWLLPCLGLTLSALALGERIGLVPAAIGIWAVWILAVLVPSLLTSEVPVVLESAASPGWIALILVAAAVVAARAQGFARLIRQL